MKIEKLTEDKIRVILDSDEMAKVIKNKEESQSLFFNILKKAEKEVDFYTDGCKLLIEAFSSNEDAWIFMITKYKNSDISKKKLHVRRRQTYLDYVNIYDFDSFETFCDFCTFLSNVHSFDIKKLCKNNSLYLYNNTYYLVLSNINEQYKNKDVFFSTILEFSNAIKHSENFENKLLEHGQILIKKNAILVGMQYFVNQKENE